MPKITYPKINVQYFAINDVYLRADAASVAQYCTERSLGSPTFVAEPKRFSNDGGLAYQYYGVPVGSTGTTESWNTVFGYDQIVQELTYS